MKKIFFHAIWLWLAAILLTTCTPAMDEYSHKPCYISIDNSIHNDATLASAMNANAPGIFCIVSKTFKNGADYFAFSNNQGQSSTSIMNAIDKRVSFIPGMNNGVIVGFGTLDNPPVFFAYDLECPNCFDYNAIPIKTKPLSMNSKGWAECKECKRIYDMNNRGIVMQGEQGKPLTRYPAATGGPYGRLFVQ